MPSREKPEKRKPNEAQPDSKQPEPLRHGLERRLHTAKSKKSAKTSKSVAIETLVEIIKTDSRKFTIASLAVIEFEHVRKSLGADAANVLVQAIEAEIAARLRQDDLVSVTGEGSFLIYLPEIAKLEAKMVMDRLTRQICMRNTERPVLPQVSIAYEFVSSEAVHSRSFLPDRNDGMTVQFNHWINRYHFAATMNFANEPVTAKDAWNHMKNVSIKRFPIPKSASLESLETLGAVFCSIQEDGLALFPKLIDFFINRHYIYLVLEPVSECSPAILNSERTFHSLIVSLCDLFLKLYSYTPPVVLHSFEAKGFSVAKENEIVLDRLDAHLIESVLNEVLDSSAYAESMKSFSNFCLQSDRKASADECLSEAQALIKNLSASEKGRPSLDLSTAKGTFQKIRAVFKRHEDKLRRSKIADAGAK